MADKPKPKPRPGQAIAPVTAEEFAQIAKPLVVVIDGQPKVANPRTFKSGSFGWHSNDKIGTFVDGKVLKVQINCSLIVIGSKPLDKRIAPVPKKLPPSADEDVDLE